MGSSLKKIIVLKNICKEFDNKKILNNVNITIYDSKITGIIGRNGSGKTVLLKIISGLYFQTNGIITYSDEVDVKKFGVLIDNGFLDNETGFNNLKLISRIRNKIKDIDIYEILKFVKLNPYDKTKYKNYSMGMKQKLKIAQAIMEDPDVIILDEPFNGLDSESVIYFRSILKEYRKNGKTIIITSHYEDDIKDLCDSVYEMKLGELKVYEKK